MTSAWVGANDIKERIELTREHLGINFVYAIGVAIYRGDPDKDRGEDVEIYIARRNAPGSDWDLPKSLLQPNEKIRVAINRIALDEMGHEVDNIKVEAREDEFITAQGKLGIQFHFAATIKEGTRSRIRMEKDHSEFRWVKAKQIENLTITPRLRDCLVACFAQIKGTVAR